MDCGFFAADAAGAKRHDRLASEFILVRGDDIGKFTEFMDAVIKRVRKRADVDFKGIARIHHDDRLAGIIMALVQPALERGRRHGWRAAFFGLDQRHFHGDDFSLELDQHFRERLLFRKAFFRRDVGEARIGMQHGDEAVDVVTQAGQEQIDPFRTQQDRAFQAEFFATRAIQRAQFRRIGDADEFISRDVDVRLSGGHCGD